MSELVFLAAAQITDHDLLVTISGKAAEPGDALSVGRPREANPAAAAATRVGVLQMSIRSVRLHAPQFEFPLARHTGKHIAGKHVAHALAVRPPVRPRAFVRNLNALSPECRNHSDALADGFTRNGVRNLASIRGYVGVGDSPAAVRRDLARFAAVNIHEVQRPT